MNLRRVGMIAGVAAGLVGLLGASSSDGEAPRPCNEKDEYRITTGRNDETFVGTGFVCADSTRYYGWFEPAHRHTDITAVLEYESGGGSQKKKYHATLIKADSVVETKELSVNLSPNTAKADFNYVWGLIPMTVTTAAYNREGKWRMDAFGKIRFTGITAKRLRCTLYNSREGPSFECRKEKGK